MPWLLVLLVLGALAMWAGGVFALYDGADAYGAGADPVERGFVEIDATGVAQWHVPALPHGTYAVKAYLDANRNGELDKGAFGIPKEPYGFSRNARGRMGPPKFRDVRFPIDAPTLTLEIRLEK